MSDALPGIPLSTYSEPLRRVPAHRATRPMAGFDPVAVMGADLVAAWLDAVGDPDRSVEDTLVNIPTRVLTTRFSFEQLCMIRASVDRYFNNGLQKMFEDENHPGCRLFGKIRSSIWQWGSYRRHQNWNELVDAYEGIRSFDLGLPGFDVLLDYAIGNNARAWTQYGDTYIDGSFAYAIRHRGEHVMTLSFSFGTRRRLLVQQVQLKRRTGNRWLFRLPQPRLEFLLSRLAAAFPRHTLHLADGLDLVEKTLEGYRSSVRATEERIETITESLERRRGASVYTEKDLAEKRRNRERTLGRIAHLEAERERIAAFYRDTGRFRPTGAVYRSRELTHHALAA